MPSALTKAVIGTLLYADIFDYPLKKEEIFRYLIGFKTGFSQIKISAKMMDMIEEKDGFYFIKGRGSILAKRTKKQKWSAEKMKILEKYIPFFRIIPSVRMVGVSGTLALNNAEKDDDIDLMIVTTGGLLWTTRFILTFFLDLVGMRRRPGDLKVNNKFCLNMFVDEVHMKIPSDERDLFCAHEVIQLLPVFDKDGTYRQFLRQNSWVRKFLPNSIRVRSESGGNVIFRTKNHSIIVRLIIILLFGFERILRFFQLKYMQKHRSSEVIRDGYVRFHPGDARKRVTVLFRTKTEEIFR